jgi:hypothetical protein
MIISKYVLPRIHPNIIQRTPFFCLNEDETYYNDEYNIEEIEPETIDLKDNLIVQICTNPCYLFLFLCMYSIWLGTYSKRQIYEAFQKKID